MTRNLTLFHRGLQALLLLVFGATAVRAAYVAVFASTGRHPVNPYVWLVAVLAETLAAGLNLATSLGGGRAAQITCLAADVAMAGLAVFAGVVTHRDGESPLVWSILALLSLIHLGAAHAAGRRAWSPPGGLR